MTNKQLAQVFRDIAAAYTIKNEQKYRFQITAYQRAADAIEGATSEVMDLFKEGKLETLPGIGTSIRSHIEELLKTGKVKHFEWILKGIPEAVFPLLSVPTFGPKKSYRLVTEFHLKNHKTVINDIERLARKGKIAHLEGFGEKSEHDILRAIKEYRLGKGKTTRMPLPYAFELAQTIVSYLKQSKAVIDAQPLGSLRRMKSTIGDIDIAVSTRDSKVVMDHFVSYPYKERVIEKGDLSSSLLVSSGKQIDLMTQPPESFGSLLQHFTGSKNHNVALREYAQTKGMSLSEKGIKFVRKKKETTKTYSTEENFYHALGMDFIPPELREDTGEIEAALAHSLPELVELRDIKGDLHTHSSYPIEPSHDMGTSTMEKMLEKAKDLGYEYLGFSEHNPSVSKHTNNQIYTILSKRQQNIEQLNTSNKYIRVISLLETDIMPNGNLSIDKKNIDLLDATLVSIHSSFSMSEPEMTKRVLQALSHPKAKILCHPTGRMINTRGGYDLNWEKVFEFCVKNNKALEINSWPERLDLPDSLVRDALKYKLKFVINTDSHEVSQMDNMRFGISVARRGWATKDDILNTLPYNEFIEWLRSE